MQTPKSAARGSSGSSAPHKASPREKTASSEASRKSSPRSAVSDTPEKASKRVVRQLKSSPHYSEPTASSSSLTARAASKGSPRLSSESKHANRVGELESQISALESDLKVVKDQLSVTEELKKKAQVEAEESNQKLLALSLKLVESQKQPSAPADVKGVSEKGGEDSTSELEEAADDDSSALASSLDDIKKLKLQLEMVAESEATKVKQLESEENELQEAKKNLSETLVLVEDMRNQLRKSKESEHHANEIAGDTLDQLERAKETVEVLKSDGVKASEAYNAVVSELEQSRARVDSLEELVKKLKDEKSEPCEEIEMEAVKLEVEQLRCALEAAELRYNEELARSSEQARNAVEMMEKITAESNRREAELESELQRSRDEINEMKANLMDKETQLQGICEENEALSMKLEKTSEIPGEPELEKELDKLRAEVENLRFLLSKQESNFKDLSDENEKLKLEIKETVKAKGSNFEPEIAAETASIKISQLSEEVDRSQKEAARAAEQLEEARGAKVEMESELRRVKVQSDQWRKAAEAAAAIISAGQNGQLMERTGSMDSRFSPRMRNVGSSPYADELEDEILKKKHPGMLTRLWRKPQK